MTNELPTLDFRQLPLSKLQESPTNPRRTFNEANLEELAQSIRAQGIVVPLIVRPLSRNGGHFEIVAGARRFRAAKLAEQESVPAQIVNLSDQQAREWQLIENAIREDVHPYEEAMAFRELLATAKRKYDVADIAAKTGKSLTHVYSRLKLAELVPAVADAFQAERITTGHAVQIARLPQEQQEQALAGAFRKDWRTNQTQLLPIREFAEWIRDNLTLTLADAVFDRESVDLVPNAGPCSWCPKRSGPNSVLFEDFQDGDGRCLDGDCFRAKVDAHIARMRQATPGLVQITRGYHSDSDSEEKILTRTEYTIVEKDDDSGRCSSATAAIVVEGPGRRGEVVQVCVDSRCEIHGKATKVREAARQQQEAEWERRHAERQRNLDRNRRLLDAVLDHAPKKLERCDLEMLAEAAVQDCEPWETIQHLAQRRGIDIDQYQEPDGLAFELRKLVQAATQEELIGLLFEVALIPSGYSEETLDADDLLVRTAKRLQVTLKSKQTSKKPHKKTAAGKGKRAKAGVAPQSGKKMARRTGGAA